MQVRLLCGNGAYLGAPITGSPGENARLNTEGGMARTQFIQLDHSMSFNNLTKTRRGRSKMVPPIPSTNASVVIKKTVRYISNNVFASSITANDLASILFVGTGTTTASSLVGSVEVERIRMWGPAPTTGATTISCEFSQESTTFIGSPSILMTDTSVDSMHPAYLDLTPPKNSLSGFWISGAATSTATVITLSGPIDTVIDLHLKIVLIDQTNIGQSVTVTAVIDGVLYFKRLMGTILVPIAWPTYT